MTKNMGTIDRIARVVIAIALLLATFVAGVVPAGIATWIATIVAVVFLATSLMGSCPLYSIFGMKTCKSE